MNVVKDDVGYQCPVPHCLLHYETSAFAELCFAHCSDNVSCNMEIARQSIEQREAMKELGLGADGGCCSRPEADGGIDVLDLSVVETHLRVSLEALQEANNAFPATQDFLRSRGFTHVRELDDAGLDALNAYLTEELRKLGG